MNEEFEDYEDDYEDEEEEEEQNDEQQQMNAVEKKKFEIEEKILKNKLMLCLARVAKGSLNLNMDEKKTVKKAKKHPNLKSQLNLITAMLLVNKAKYTFV